MFDVRFRTLAERPAVVVGDDGELLRGVGADDALGDRIPFESLDAQVLADVGEVAERDEHAHLGTE